MASLNKVILVGHLGRDPEVRYTQNGTAVANFNIATNEYQGQGKEDKVEWHTIVAWGKLADFAKNYLEKGRQVLVEGRIQSRTYEGRDGTTKKAFEIVANKVLGLGPKNGGGSRSESSDHDDGDQGFTGATDDDIPF